MAKKIKKKIAKRKIKKSPKKTVGKTAKKVFQPKPIGKITHYYGNIKVAIIKFNKPFKAGGAIKIKGATTDFEQTVSSIQYNHEPVKVAKKNQQVGVKVKKKVREGDIVYSPAK
jgi:putative protease